MDNDTGGFKAVTKLEETLSDRDILLKRDMPDKSGYDWNDMLCSAAGGKQQEVIEYMAYAKQHKESLHDLKADRTTIVINAFGGPGSGKTTSCMNICAELKSRDSMQSTCKNMQKSLFMIRTLNCWMAPPNISLKS